jgi:hypothetical protein
VLTGIAVTTLGALAYTQVTAHTNELVLAASLLVWGIGSPPSPCRSRQPRTRACHRR